MAFKMKASPGGPMRKNFGISPVKQNTIPTFNDSMRAVRMRELHLKDGLSEKEVDKQYNRFTKFDTPGNKKSRKILSDTDKVTKSKRQTRDVLLTELRKSHAKREQAELLKSAKPGTTSNTRGILRGSKNKNTTFNTGLNIGKS